MRRAFLLFGVAMLAFVVLSQDGTQAVNNSFAERFAGDTKMGDSGTYNFDKAHSFIGFKIGHNGLIEVPGFFRDFTGSVNLDAKEIAKSTVEFTAKATSIDTGFAGRDDHLRKPEFFDVAKFPDITFKSTSVAKKGNDWMLTGDFTMKGVTKSITFPFKITGFLPANERNGGRMGMTAETTINRREFGVSYDSKMPNGMQVVSDEVKVVLQIEAVKPKPAPATAQ